VRSFFGFAGAAAALVFSNLGAAYGTAKAGYVSTVRRNALAAIDPAGRRLR
jgi:hypothetical protein